MTASSGGSFPWHPSSRQCRVMTNRLSVQTPSKPWWWCPGHIRNFVGRSKGAQKSSQNKSADHLFFSPSGGPWSVTQLIINKATWLINELKNEPKSKQNPLGHSRGFLVFQCLYKNYLWLKTKGVTKVLCSHVHKALTEVQPTPRGNDYVWTQSWTFSFLTTPFTSWKRSNQTDENIQYCQKYRLKTHTLANKKYISPSF